MITPHHKLSSANRRSAPKGHWGSRTPRAAPLTKAGVEPPWRGLTLVRSWPLGVGALFVIAFAWRWMYLARLAKSPLAGWMLDDARIYWAWSERIASGHLVGLNPFFLAPLYPYVLGVLRALGSSSAVVLVIQALWGAAAVALLADAVRRLTRPTIGLAVGLMLCFYEMAVFFDGLFLTESLMFFLGSLLMWWVVRRGATAETWWTDAATGVLIGLLAAGRATMALVLLPAALFLASHAPVLRRLAALIAGFALVAVPIALHNYVVAREWIPFTYNFGYNLYAGNNPRAIGLFVPITGEHEGQPLGLDGGLEVDGNAREYPQIENVEEYRALAGPVGLPVVGRFAWLGALALVGAAFAWRAGAMGRFVLGYAAVVTLGTLPFFVTDRYRHQLVPACAVLAGLGLQRLVKAVAGRRWVPLGVLVAGLLVVHLPTPGPSAQQQATLLARNTGERFQLSALSAARAGDLERAATDFDRAVQADPRRYDAWGGLMRAQVQLGRAGEARETFSRARAAGLPGPATQAYQALFAALDHDAAAAEAALGRIPRTSLEADPGLAEVVAVTRRILSGAR